MKPIKKKEQLKELNKLLKVFEKDSQELAWATFLQKEGSEPSYGACKLTAEQKELEKLVVRCGFVDCTVHFVKQVATRWTVNFAANRILLSPKNTPKQNARGLLAAYLRLMHYQSGEEGPFSEERASHVGAGAVLTSLRDNTAMWEYIFTQFPKARPLAQFDPCAKVRVRDRTFKITLMSKSECERRNVFGLCHFAKKTIFLDPALEGNLRRCILLHEIFHFFHDAERLENGASAGEFSTVQAHRVIKLAEQNPHLWSFLADSSWAGRLRS